MGKFGIDFDPEGYAPVADRIRLFYQTHPLGRIETELVRHTAEQVVFKALVYRSATDPRAAATGWAAEREGDGDINVVACLENAETSAIGRALANLGFTASRERPSAEEMTKARRTRARLTSVNRNSTGLSVPPSEASSGRRNLMDDDPLQRQANELLDALHLIRTAQRLGLRSARATRLRARIVASTMTPETLDRLSTILRRWIDKRRAETVRSTPPPP